MVIDILFLLAMAMAVFKGFAKGFIIGLFSFVAYYIGLAAALKLSTLVARYLGGGKEHQSVWLPVISFLIVFIAVVILVNIVARLIRGIITISTLGWLDRLAGIVLFVIVYLFIFSILVFYAVKISLFSENVTASSRVYPYISPIAPHMLGLLGKILPFFNNMFSELQTFFEGAGSRFSSFIIPLKY